MTPDQVYLASIGMIGLCVKREYDVFKGSNGSIVAHIFISYEDPRYLNRKYAYPYGHLSPTLQTLGMDGIDVGNL